MRIQLDIVMMHPDERITWKLLPVMFGYIFFIINIPTTHTHTQSVVVIVVVVVVVVVVAGATMRDAHHHSSFRFR